MSLVVSAETKGPYVNVSPGRHLAVVADVVDLGYQDTPFGEKHKVRLVYETDETHPEKEWPLSLHERFTLSLHEKGNLRPRVEQILGRPLTNTEVKQGFDLESIIGCSFEVAVVHREVGEKVYANVQSIMPLRPGDAALAVSEGYVRVKDREDQQSAPEPQAVADTKREADQQEVLF